MTRVFTCAICLADWDEDEGTITETYGFVCDECDPDGELED